MVVLRSISYGIDMHYAASPSRGKNVRDAAMETKSEFVAAAASFLIRNALCGLIVRRCLSSESRGGEAAAVRLQHRHLPRVPILSTAVHRWPDHDIQFLRFSASDQILSRNPFGSLLPG
jgi:hypothetical protein